MKKKRIILFSPRPASNAYFDGVPIALLAVSRLLDQEGRYDIKIITASGKENYVKEIVRLASNAICLGISSMTGYQIQDGLEVSRAVKAKYPQLPIIWGGWHPTICADQTLANQLVDIVVRGGQGERTFFELVHRLEEGKSLRGILGISFKHNGKIIHNSERPFENINNFPPLPYHLIDIEKYTRASEYGSRTIDYVSSIGCPHRCSFCSEQLVNKRRWSGLSPERVIDDLRKLNEKYKINTIFFHDSNFFVDENRVREICKGIIKNKIVVKLGQLDARTSQLVRYKKSTWKLMKKSGFVSMLVGAESGSQKVLDYIKKDATTKDTVAMAKICKIYDIGIVLSLMLGLPRSNGEFQQSVDREFKQTESMIDRVIATGVNLNICGWFVYTPYPGTPLHKISIQNGWQSPVTLDDWAKFNLNKKNTPWIAQKYVSLLNQLSSYVFPCMGTTYLGTWTYRSQNTPRDMFLRTIIIQVLKLLQRTASFRWKHKFFSFPIEGKLINIYSDQVKRFNLT